MKQVLVAGLVVLLLVVGGVYYLLQDRTDQTQAETSTPPEKSEPASSESSPTVTTADPVGTPTTVLERAEEPLDPETSMRETVKAHTAFAMDLYKVLLRGNSGQNEFFSPYSISAILSLTSAGGRGRTADELNKLLHISNTTAINAGTAKLTHDLVDTLGGPRPYQLSVANSLWSSSSYPMLPSFTAVAEKHYDTAGVYVLDFRAREKEGNAGSGVNEVPGDVGNRLFQFPSRTPAPPHGQLWS